MDITAKKLVSWNHQIWFREKFFSAVTTFATAHVFLNTFQKNNLEFPIEISGGMSFKRRIFPLWNQFFKMQNVAFLIFDSGCTFDISHYIWDLLIVLPNVFFSIWKKVQENYQCILDIFWIVKRNFEVSEQKATFSLRNKFESVLPNSLNILHAYMVDRYISNP